MERYEQANFFGNHKARAKFEPKSNQFKLNLKIVCLCDHISSFRTAVDQPVIELIKRTKALNKLMVATPIIGLTMCVYLAHFGKCFEIWNRCVYLWFSRFSTKIPNCIANIIEAQTSHQLCLEYTVSLLLVWIYKSRAMLFVFVCARVLDMWRLDIQMLYRAPNNKPP